MNLSVLQRATKADVMLDPYPYMVIENALPEDLYQELAKDYPSYDTVVRNRPLRNLLTYDARDILRVAEQSVSPLWLEFIKYHTSKNFYLEVISLFGDVIRKEYPHLEPSLGKKLEDVTTGIRWRDQKADVGVECQFGINPQPTDKYIRKHHIDERTELYAMLLYMRPDEDKCEGGDLGIYRWKKGAKPKYYNKYSVPPGNSELVKKVRYGANTLFFFINTLDSIHAVTGHPMPNGTFRRYVNVLADMHHVALWEENNQPITAIPEMKIPPVVLPQTTPATTGIDLELVREKLARSQSKLDQAQKQLEIYKV
ncbi:MAG: hypothetical protein F6K39_02340 [Okeania sp. SIO3B3]|nr:hypothetical protein [Okeania sp. SIO3B3]